MNAPALGCPVADLDTPALCIDLDVFESNIRRMAEACRQHGVAWRPHSKAHKSPEIARLEIDAGAIGVTCAKLGEAEVMADGGIGGLLIANQVVGPQKMCRLMGLCRKTDPIVAVDDVVHLDQLSRAASSSGVTLSVMPEVDIGMGRAGVLPGKPSVELAVQATRLPGLKLAGIMGYEGHLLRVEDPREKEHKIREAMAVLVATKEAIEKAGVPCPIVSAGGTGSYATTITCPGITELQAGGLIFMDAYYRHRCHVSDFGYSLTLWTTIVSRPAPDRAIIDAGRKSQYAESHPPIVVGREGIRLVQLSAEHGQLELDEANRDLKVGDRLELVPGYSDFTTVLHDEFYGIRKGRLEVIWPLKGRGKIR